MLSPSMMANVNGNRFPNRRIWFATSYCWRSPVPASPRTRNRTDPGLRGSAISCASTGTAPIDMTIPVINARGFTTASSHGYCVRHEVDDNVRLDVPQHEIVLDDAVLEFVGERRQERKELRRERRERIRRGVQRVHLRLEVRQLVLCVAAGFLYRVGAPAVFLLDHRREHRRDLRGEDVPGFGVRTS